MTTHASVLRSGFAAIITLGVTTWLYGVATSAQQGLQGSPGSKVQGSQAAPAMTVYKSATCGCCSKWIDHMREAGFVVKSMDVDDISAVKATYGVPVEAGSCHTALVSGYVVEGHVPASTVKRLLREKPKITGIAAPGMPVGSPGMEVPSGEVERYNVMSFQKNGAMTVFEKR